MHCETSLSHCPCVGPPIILVPAPFTPCCEALIHGLMHRWAHGGSRWVLWLHSLNVDQARRDAGPFLSLGSLSVFVCFRRAGKDARSHPGCSQAEPARCRFPCHTGQIRQKLVDERQDGCGKPQACTSYIHRLPKP